VAHDDFVCAGIVGRLIAIAFLADEVAGWLLFVATLF